MIEHHFDPQSAVLHIRPVSALAKEDFATLAAAVDPFISQTGDLAGILIEAPSFPGWESLGAMAAHFRFVREHHKHIRKVALVTDSVLGTAAENLASHFVSAEIKKFPASEAAMARQWIVDRSPPNHSDP